MSLTSSPTRRAVGYVSLFAALLLALNALFLAAPAAAEDLDSPCDQYGYTKIDAASGSTTGEWGSIAWGGADGTDANELAYDVEPGWSLEICIKGGNVDNTFAGPFTGSGSVTHPNPDISHIGYIVETAPVSVTPREPTFTDPTCESNEAGLVLPDGPEGVTYQVTGDQEPGGTVTVTAVADEGYTIPSEATSEWTHTYGPAATDCEEPTEVTPQEPTFTDPTCESNEAGLVLPDGPEGVTYQVTGDQEPGGTVTVTAVADEGYTIPSEATSEWTHTYGPAATDCEEPTTGVEPDVVVRPAVSFTDPDCANPNAAAVTVTEVDGVEYTVSGDIEPGGTAVVTAAATEGHRIDRGAQTTWTHVFPTLDCDVEVLPNVVTKPQPAPSAALAATGLDSTELLLLALLLLGLGGVMLAPQYRGEH